MSQLDSSSFSKEDTVGGEQRDSPHDMTLDSKETKGDLIAVGGTCLTYRIRLHGRLHAKKQLAPQYVKEPHYRALLDKEFDIAYPLDFSTLPRYISKGEDDGGPYLLMEYIDGIPLDAFLKESPDYFRDKHHQQHFAQQLLRTLQYLHSRQILHLDIKPQNILVTRIGHELKLVDFGFAYSDSIDTLTGHSPQFAAPEQLESHRPYDQRTDLYSAGKILELVYGCETKITRRLTQLNPNERFASATEALSVLENKHSILKWGFLCICLIFLASSAWIWQHRTFTKEEQPRTDSIQTTGPISKQIEKETEKPTSIDKSPAAEKHVDNTLKEEPWRKELRQMVDKEFDAFYASYTVLTEENYDSLIAKYQTTVGRLLDAPTEICNKYPNAPEQEVSAAIYQDLDRVTPTFRIQVDKLFKKRQ